MFDPNTHKVFASKDVLFHENAGEVPKEDGYDVWNLHKKNEEKFQKRK